MTNNDLKQFYHSLSKLNADSFRKEVMERCEWTYAIWLTKVNGPTSIKKLEEEAITIIQAGYLTSSKSK